MSRGMPTSQDTPPGPGHLLSPPPSPLHTGKTLGHPRKRQK
ncbi:hypothetical protein E2C01_018440 [Portunus trituberculatus]|uniref:Uncharacterized protein n=1 Tax=Portunus trituberculatus TaxID=210409 RepID=A0A5B7DX06_PORTR|nr:hypothetical protein [Portunus trituberculatus]